MKKQYVPPIVVLSKSREHIPSGFSRVPLMDFGKSKTARDRSNKNQATEPGD
jgi:hypothetical protein